MAKNGKKSVVEIITDRIISKLEEGKIPWEKPWVGGMPPTRISCMKPYRGINLFLLGDAAEENEYSTNYWGSYKQWGAKGCAVRPEEAKNYQIAIFWKFFKTEVKIDKKTGEEKVVDRPPLCRYYRVYNYDQTVMNLELETPAAPDVAEVIERAEEIIKGMPNPPKISHAGSRAYYRPSDDKVNLPPRKLFKNSTGYYSVAYHELAHSTGHPVRVGRFTHEISVGLFGSESYSKEELVAEMSSAMLCNIAGLDPKVINNQAAYIASWLSVLKDDRQFIISAASQAQAAVEYITRKEVTNGSNGN
jgi:antirestriction protein ArdC